jgi:hypothetical protein
MADKNKLKKISAELKKASKMHAAQAEKIENMSKGPSMINIAGAVAGLGKQIKNQKKSTAVGSVAPHSHDSSKDNAQQIPPITPPMPDNITGNIGNNFKVQELGKSMFQGEEMANQFAQKQMDKPVPPPGDAMGDQYGNMFNQPFAQNKIEKALVLEKPRLPKKFKMEPKKEKTKMYLPSIWRETRHEVHLPKLEKPKQKKVIQRVNMEGPLAQTNNYKYKKGDLIDETDHEESTYRSSNEGVVSGKRYNVENVSEIQEDDKGQFMTTLGEREYFGGPKPTSSRVTNYDQGVNSVRDTLRPQRGKVFISNWKKNK